ncbi:type II toxin-antitoxin system HicA family toxin [Candidatus Kaiserbacteria bacterium CG10_big_fil_rev_8_21_14_0_10_45_20]|uniref:Type II toxin-antitoxin system HicA family toxin n=1 Tax=Candidatus Kaiserbacteria bacterium CG10_big_fil_rev_8_21_14_0_10_45_20 TaxID=1974607 RepID=A0A2H0UI07_9BACT|nr:MAG: type II toxin-antitoxin system HicA family toxin [Candidatus Kaiserbacteria bacterium CG10_big_fil_rev_8_21_14_0_10_45_20]
MAKLYSSAHIVKILQQYGFFYVSQRGSHAKFQKKKPRKTQTVIVPANRKEIPVGTFNSILKQSGLEESDFAKNSKRKENPK